MSPEAKSPSKTIRVLGSVGVASMMVTIGCEPLPPLDYESEHALVGTDIVDRVCAGSLARIDAEIEYVDDLLGRGADADPAHIYVVASVDALDHCEEIVGGCVSWEQNHATIFISRGSFDRALTHEIVHERILRTVGKWTKPVFDEGIASAIGVMHREPSEGSEPPSVDTLLGSEQERRLFEVPGSYYYAGELVHWMIQTDGLEQVLALMDGLDYDASPEQVRAAYAARFGRSLDDDMFAHRRDLADLSASNLACTGQGVEPEQGGFHLVGDLACDSPRVENDWTARDRVFVEWVIHVSQDNTGVWAPIRWYGDDEIPAHTWIRLSDCQPGFHLSKVWSHDESEAVELPPGSYRIRWYGPMDDSHELDLWLGRV